MPHTQPYSSSLYNLFFLSQKIKEQRQSSISLSRLYWKSSKVDPTIALDVVNPGAPESKLKYMRTKV
jgi:hypothetical protein